MVNIKNNKLRKEFPIISSRKITYLDSAATTQKPKIVIDSIKKFYEQNNANAHRGIYDLSEESTDLLHKSREIIAAFINASPEEIIFTKNSTEGFNNIAASLEKTLMIDPAHNVVTTVIEHHSSYLPMQQLCSRTGAELRIVDYDNETNTLEEISKYVDDHTMIVAFTAMSNVTGLIIDVKSAIEKIRKINPNAVIIIDATQLAPHKSIDVKDLDADFLVFSAHKIYGPTGVGILYGKFELLNKIEPFSYGGNMINKVNVYDSDWAEVPDKFEAGTIDTPGIVAASVAIEFFDKNREYISEIEDELLKYALKELKKIPDLKIIGHEPGVKAEFGPVISFVIEGLHPHDIATICNEYKVCIRAGHHCAQPFMNKLGLNATSRISIGAYTNQADIDNSIKALKEARKILGK
ncbi:MAG TPA: aminotransferase class V-fold PLP-dependent enzyme [Alphaproteobacteria bacterium]|nr:aminotransferase class V-fold PLP-dependent enzyme [Alphaproteobacteria bacterium]